MTITNGYATIAEFKSRFYPVGIVDITDDAVIEAIIEAVSRLIDERTGRRFYKNTTDETRYYTAQRGDELIVDDLVSITTLKTDEDGDRTYETTWAATDYDLLPYNAALDGKPYFMIQTSPNGDYSFPLVEKGIQISGVFGWPAVPKMIKEACLIQSSRLFKRKDAPFGVTGTAEMGQLSVIARLDPDVTILVDPYRHLNVG
jgi:hypothetical protein